MVCDEENCNFESSDWRVMVEHSVEKHGMTREASIKHWEPI